MQARKTTQSNKPASRVLGTRLAVASYTRVDTALSGAPSGANGATRGSDRSNTAVWSCWVKKQLPAMVVCATLASIMACAATIAQARLFCDGEAVEGWHFYCDPEPAPELEETPPSSPAEDPEEIVEDEVAPEPTPPSATEQITAFREMAEEAKNKAILDPTVENVIAYMEINREMAQMAGRFAAVWQRGLFQSPHLDANVNRPLTQMGTHIYQDQLNAVREAALKRAAQEAGLIFVYENPVTCRVCLAQSEILSAIRAAHGIEVLAVSSDGTPIEHFPDAVVDEGQLDALGVLDVPKPFIAVLDVETGEAQLIGGGLLTEDQILERIYVIREVPLGERYE